MSLNAINLSPSRTPTPLQDEIDIRTVDNIDYVLTLSDASAKKIEGRGRIFLTDLRLMIVADAVGADAFESLAVLHTALLALKQEPPRLFNAPRVVLDLAAGARECARAELRCAKGDKDAFARFAAALDKTRERAVNKSRANPEDEMDLPAYGAPGASGSGAGASSTTTYVTADVPSDAPPGYEP